MFKMETSYDQKNLAQAQFEENFNKCKDDVEKFRLVRDNQHMGITLYIDNDYTYAMFDNCDSPVMEFTEYTGNSGGVENLLILLGIKYKHA